MESLTIFAIGVALIVLVCIIIICLMYKKYKHNNELAVTTVITVPETSNETPNVGPQQVIKYSGISSFTFTGNKVLEKRSTDQKYDSIALKYKDTSRESFLSYDPPIDMFINIQQSSALEFDKEITLHKKNNLINIVLQPNSEVILNQVKYVRSDKEKEVHYIHLTNFRNCGFSRARLQRVSDKKDFYLVLINNTLIDKNLKEMCETGNITLCNLLMIFKSLNTENLPFIIVGGFNVTYEKAFEYVFDTKSIIITDMNRNNVPSTQVPVKVTENSKEVNYMISMQGIISSTSLYAKNQYYIERSAFVEDQEPVIISLMKIGDINNPESKPNKSLMKNVINKTLTSLPYYQFDPSTIKQTTFVENVDYNIQKY